MNKTPEVLQEETMRPQSHRILVLIVLSLFCTSPAAFGQGSTEQWTVDLRYLLQDLEEMKSLAVSRCIPIFDRDVLLTAAKRWIDAFDSEKPVQSGLAPTYGRVRALVAEIEAVRLCPTRSEKPTSAPAAQPRSASPAVNVGTSAGQFATDAAASVFVGESAGREARNSDFATVAGHVAGYSLNSSPGAVVLGYASGQNLTHAPNSVALGASAGRNAQESGHALFLGGSSGYDAREAHFSIMLGYAAGRRVEGTPYSFLTGYAAGEYAHRSDHTIMAGAFAGYRAHNSPRSVLVGTSAGMYANNGVNSVMIGLSAGRRAANSESAVFIGTDAGKTAAGTTDIVLIGTGTDAEPGIRNAVGIGRGARPTRSDTWHIPGDLKVGLGTSSPTAQLHVVGNIRIEGIRNGLLITDSDGNVGSLPIGDHRLVAIEQLSARVQAIESGLPVSSPTASDGLTSLILPLIAGVFGALIGLFVGARFTPLLRSR